MKILMLMLICAGAYAQKYDYAELSMIRAGISDKKPEIVFQFATTDSTKIYNDMKLPHIVNAIQLLESRGYELVTVTNQNAMGAIVTIAYLRRKRK